MTDDFCVAPSIILEKWLKTRNIGPSSDAFSIHCLVNSPIVSGVEDVGSDSYEVAGHHILAVF